MPSKCYVPFLQATSNVFELMLDLADISDCSADAFNCEDELDISIEITGDLTGEVVYRFPCETCLNIVGIMSGMDMDEVDDFVISAICEISNIISGNVMTALADEDLSCDIRPPRFKRAGDCRPCASHSTRCLCTSAGEVCLEIRLNANRSAQQPGA